MNQSLNTEQSMTTGASRRIAFAQACWHRDIVDRGRDAFVGELEVRGISADRIDFFEVPGSLEIPLQAKLLDKTGRYSVIVAAGFVVDGGIYRHDFVAASVVDAMMRVQLETEVPIISFVLTPQSFHETAEHRNFFLDHFVTKGGEAAAACAQTLANLARLKALTEVS